MATRLKPTDAPDVVGQILLIPVAEIEAGKRLRAIDVAWAGALGKMMKVDGQKTAIEVCRLPGRTKWTLVAGAHRHAGAQSEGIAFLRAIVVESDADTRLDREISENLDRLELDPLDRAAFIAERVGQLKQRAGITAETDGRVVSAATRWKKELSDEATDANDTMSFAYGWSEKIGERLRLDKRTIERDLYLHRRIPAGLIARLRAHEGGAGHPALRNATQLHKLAKLDEDQQKGAIDRLLWEEQSSAKKAMTLSDAIAAGLAKNKGKPKAPDRKRLDTFTDTFNRMGVAEKKGALEALRIHLPAGYQIVADPVPAVPLRASVKHDHCVCLDCGEEVQLLSQHVNAEHDLSWVQYLGRWNLPLDYPMRAPSLRDDDDVEGYAAVALTVDAVFDELMALDDPLDFIDGSALLDARTRIEQALNGDRA